VLLSSGQTLCNTMDWFILKKVT